MLIKWTPLVLTEQRHFAHSTHHSDRADSSSSSSREKRFKNVWFNAEGQLDFERILVGIEKYKSSLQNLNERNKINLSIFII